MAIIIKYQNQQNTILPILVLYNDFTKYFAQIHKAFLNFVLKLHELVLNRNYLYNESRINY